MSINAAGGARFFIGGAGKPADLAAFQSESYIEVGEVEDLGQLGDESAEITFTSLADGRVQKLKGPRDAGTMAIVAGDDPTDPGQLAMVAAEASSLDYACRVVLNDQLTLSGTPSEMYFYGKIMGKRKNIGNATNVVRKNFNVGVNSAVYEIMPT